MLLFYLTYQHVAINVTSPFSGELSGVSGVLCIMEQIASKLLHFIFGVAGLILTLMVVLGHAPRQTSPPAGRGQAIAPTMDEGASVQRLAEVLMQEVVVIWLPGGFCFSLSFFLWSGEGEEE